MLSSGSATHQAGHQFRFYLFDTGNPSSGAAVGDQKRVMTPADAYQIGSDYIVVGRPITQAEDPVAAYHAIKDEWNQD